MTAKKPAAPRKSKPRRYAPPMAPEQRYTRERLTGFTASLLECVR